MIDFSSHISYIELVTSKKIYLCSEYWECVFQSFTSIKAAEKVLHGQKITSSNFDKEAKTPKGRKDAERAKTLDVSLSLHFSLYIVTNKLCYNIYSRSIRKKAWKSEESTKVINLKFK